MKVTLTTRTYLAPVGGAEAAPVSGLAWPVSGARHSATAVLSACESAYAWRKTLHTVH